MHRRQFLTKAGISGLGAATLSLAAAGAVEAKQIASEVNFGDIESLKKSYAELDTRTKMLFRAVLVLAGLDILLLI